MRDLIRHILREDTNISVLKKYITGIFEKQISEGKIPFIPVDDLIRKKIYQDNVKLINSFYLEFVGGVDKAKDNLFKSIELTTDKDVRDLGYSIHPQDSYEIIIPWMDFDDNSRFIFFGFAIRDCKLTTDRGLMTYEELLDDTDDQFWVEVTDWLRGDIEDYVMKKSFYFGLEGYVTESVWSD